MVKEAECWRDNVFEGVDAVRSGCSTVEGYGVLVVQWRLWDWVAEVLKTCRDVKRYRGDFRFKAALREVRASMDYLADVLGDGVAESVRREWFSASSHCSDRKIEVKDERR